MSAPQALVPSQAVSASIFVFIISSSGWLVPTGRESFCSLPIETCEGIAQLLGGTLRARVSSSQQTAVSCYRLQLRVRIFSTRSAGATWRRTERVLVVCGGSLVRLQRPALRDPGLRIDGRVQAREQVHHPASSVRPRSLRYLFDGAPGASLTRSAARLPSLDMTDVREGAPVASGQESTAGMVH